MARVTITDQGPGIDESAKQAIFERFKQAKAEDTKKGTGLGLPIAKAFIEAHGGEIGVTSTPGQGSTFYFTLPLDADYLKEDAEDMAEAEVTA